MARIDTPVDLVLDPEHRDRGLDRRQHPFRGRPESGANTFLQDDRQAEGSHDRQGRRVLDRLDDRVFDNGPERETDDRHDQKGQPIIARRFRDEPTEHGADHEEVAMRDIDDVEQTENYG
jgi:hypothetical protein